MKKFENIGNVIAFVLVLSLGVAGEARAECINGVDEENKPCGEWNCGTQNSEVKCTLSDGTLKIVGSGAMVDFGWGQAPWYADQMRASIKNIEVGQGVTSIANFAFFNLTNAENISLPDSLTDIGTKAFWNMPKIKNLDIPDSVVSFDYDAFYNTGAPVSIPDSVENTGQGAINHVGYIIISDDLDVSNWSDKMFNNSVRSIICRGELENCKKAFEKYLLDEDGNCREGVNCVGSRWSLANQEQCTGKYVWNGASCKRMNEEQCNNSLKYQWVGGKCKNLPSSINTCQNESFLWVRNSCKKSCPRGQVYYKFDCLDEYPFAKKKYTPAEAAQWLNEDDNTITLTFKK